MGEKCRKQGRNKKWCEGYRARGQREKNKALRIIRRVKREGLRPHLLEALKRLPASSVRDAARASPHSDWETVKAWIA